MLVNWLRNCIRGVLSKKEYSYNPRVGCSQKFQADRSYVETKQASSTASKKRRSWLTTKKGSYSKEQLEMIPVCESQIMIGPVKSCSSSELM
jgi:hypothetical protein